MKVTFTQSSLKLRELPRLGGHDMLLWFLRYFGFTPSVAQENSVVLANCQTWGSDFQSLCSLAAPHPSRSVCVEE